MATRLPLPGRHRRQDREAEPGWDSWTDTDDAVLDMPPRVEGRMPELDGATEWLNSPPLTREGLRGSVVVVQFWTYTCINWLRTVAHIRAWDATFRDRGLVVIGVHSPEFSVEHDVDNIRSAVQAMRISYPVAVDNDFAVWRAFANHYWPALYVVDAQGRIRHHLFGEGAYDEASAVVRYLLEDAGAGGIPTARIPVEARGIEVPADWDHLGSGETYTGYERTENFASPGNAVLDGPGTYAIPDELGRNEWALAGSWTLGPESATSNAVGGRLAFRFHARDLHLVMGPGRGGPSVPFRVLIDGEPPGPHHGEDTDADGRGTVNEARLHQLVRQRRAITDRTFVIEFLEPGAQALCFTFG
jgi:alkyl hydroperoxide reductase subunit AhpC